MNEKSISSFELSHIVRELKALEGSRIGKIYNSEKEVVIVTSHGSLYAFPGGCFLSKKSFEVPTNFAMLLRKYMKDRVITRIYQHKIDRVVVVETQGINFIMELFHKGNFILADSEWKIIMPLEFQRWKDRELVPKKLYKFPESKDIRDLNILRTETGNGVEKALVVNGFGKYAHEVMREAGINEGPLDQESLLKLRETIVSFFERRTDPLLIIGKDGYEDAIPFPMQTNCKTEKAENFSAALEKLHAKYSLPSAAEKKLNAEKRILDQQKEKAKEFEMQEAEHQRKAEILNRNFSEAEVLLKDVASLKNAKKLRDAKSLLGNEKVVSVDEKKSSVTVRFESENIELSLGKNLQKNIGNFYERAKFYRKKRENVTKEMGKVLDRMNIAVIKERRATKEKKWYHKYRHFFTSDGFLVVAGKDAASNESLVKKHMETRDVVFHAEIHGAAFTVLKAGDSPSVSEQALKEAAQFAACYSKAWPMGLGSVSVYWVNPDQVDKTVQSGEHIGKGSFMIHGKKNYVKPTRLELACGLVDGEIIVAPLETLSKKTTKLVAIVPGDLDANKVSKKAVQKLKEVASKSEQALLQKTNIANMIPSGRGSIGD